MLLGIQDGDASDASSWTCLSGEVCGITHDLRAVESLEQLRVGEMHLIIVVALRN